eukprot:821801_1
MGDFVAVLLFCCIANIQLSQAPSNLGPLECGETVTGFFDLIRLFTNGVYYELSLTETTTFFGTFDTCKPGTNISTQIDFLSTSGSMDSLNPWMGIHYNHELPCSINSNYTIMYYNISPSWIADNGATFRVNLNSPQQANNDIGTYEVSLSCGPPTTPPSQSPSSEPTAPTTSPSASPSSAPSTSPSASPSASPSSAPTTPPSSAPSTSPSTSPSSAPTTPPSSAPTTPPSTSPSASPSASPSSAPTTPPSSAPSTSPSTSPSSAPTTPPSSAPSTSPSTSPSSAPTTPPSSAPTTPPSTSPSAS